MAKVSFILSISQSQPPFDPPRRQIGPVRQARAEPAPWGGGNRFCLLFSPLCFAGGCKLSSAAKSCWCWLVYDHQERLRLWPKKVLLSFNLFFRSKVFPVNCTLGRQCQEHLGEQTLMTTWSRKSKANQSQLTGDAMILPFAIADCSRIFSSHLDPRASRSPVCLSSNTWTGSLRICWGKFYLGEGGLGFLFSFSVIYGGQDSEAKEKRACWNTGIVK